MALADNEHGRLADGTENARTAPQQIVGVVGVTALASATASWFAITGGSSFDEALSTGL